MGVRRGVLDGYGCGLWSRRLFGLTSPEAVRDGHPGGRPRRGEPWAPVVKLATAVRPAHSPAGGPMEGALTTSRSLLDASGRANDLEDTTGAIEAYLAAAEPDEAWDTCG